MKLLYVCEYFPPEANAAATRIGEHVRRWQAAGHSVVVITCVPNFPQGVVHAGYRNAWWQVEDYAGVRVVRVKTFVHPNRGRLGRILDQASLLPGALVAGLVGPRPDAVVASSPTLFAALAGAWIAALRRVPFVLELGDLGAASIVAVGVMRYGMLLRLVTAIERHVYRRAARIVAQTAAMRDAVIAAGIDAAKVAVIANGVDVAAFASVPAARAQTAAPAAAAPGIPDVAARHAGAASAAARPLTVGYLGTMGLAHGLEFVLDAAQALRARSDIAFYLVGDGAARAELEAAAAARNLGNVTFAGPFPHSAMPAQWARVDVALVSLRDHPTFTTVIPSKIFEAAAAGAPVLLAAPEGEATALVRRYGLGLTLPPGDGAALAASIAALADDRTRLAKLAANATAAAPQFDRALRTREYLTLLEDVVSGGRGGV